MTSICCGNVSYDVFDTAITIENLSASRGGFTLFQNISFQIAPGTAMRVTGPNGTGKTTLLRCLAGLVRPDSGAISKTNQQGLHYLGHLNAMKPQLTVAENLRFWAKADHGSNVADAYEAMNLNRLIDLPFTVLSSGQKRRVALARLLLSPRPIWLLDEPTVGLDDASVALVEIMLGTHLSNGGLIIAATHTPLGNAGWQTLELAPVLSWVLP